MTTSTAGSVADIQIDPSPAPSRPSPDMLMPQLLDDCGTNKNDCTTVFIKACIDDGVNTKRRIIGRGAYFGLNPAHVALILKQGTGTHPAGFEWRRNPDGTYSLLT